MNFEVRSEARLGQRWDSPAEFLIALHPDWRRIVDVDEAGRPVTLRQFEEIDEFAEAMSSGDRKIRVRYVDELDRVPETLIVCEECVAETLLEESSLDARNLYRRIFLLNVERGHKNAKRIDSLGMAGAIIGLRYRVWRTERADDPGGGVFGRRDVAAGMGASWGSSGIWNTERYCLFWHSDYPTLPLLLSQYLVAYGRRLLK
ncbi:hypothetical protein AB0L85_20905 [Streptomyces sp. NPDC052051]|uniref:hypothetical protein n=1 Tax=Streptomyces sp. NPDC052051 TaxID=3154649 RepID=UPI00343CE449